jgi:hypothetical protein
VTLVDQHPLVVEVDQKIAAHSDRRAQFEANVSALAVADEATQRVYSEQLDQAMRTGSPAPEPPVLRLNGADVDVRHGFMVEGQQLTAERRTAVAEAYDDILRVATREAIKTAKGAKPTVEKLLLAMAEVAELLAAIRTCRDARNDNGLEGRKVYRDARLTLEAFVTLAVTGGDPTDLLDLAGNRRGVENRDTGLVLGDIQQLLAGSRVAPQPVTASQS